MAEDLGYTPITTFWQDFSIADKFGPAAIRDTFKRAFAEWKGNYKYLNNPEKGAANVLANLYNELWEQADEYASSHLEGDEYAYYYRITD